MKFSQQESLDMLSLGLIRQGRPGYVSCLALVEQGEWGRDWLQRVCKVAEDFGLDRARVLDAVRAKGWEIPEGLT